MKALAVSVWAVCLDGGRGGDIEDSHSGREAGGWGGGRALFQAADDDAFHDLKIEFRTLREVGGREGGCGFAPSRRLQAASRPTRSLRKVNK